MVQPVHQHPWDLDPRSATALQNDLAARVLFCDLPQTPSLIGGVDVGIKHGLARAAVVLFSYPQLEMLEQVVAELPVSYPYVPGLLTFREAPAILDALAQLEHEPEVLLFDGQGYAHPRRMGLATHLGILLDRPTIGCAKSRLCGQAELPHGTRGSHTLLYEGSEVIGALLRTRTNVRPLYISVGHRARLSQAIDLVLHCGGGYRLPEPTRWAHRLASGTARTSP